MSSSETAHTRRASSVLDPEQSRSLLVYTAIPGSESHDKLQLLSVIRTQTVAAPGRG